jgi:hypothetical protein
VVDKIKALLGTPTVKKVVALIAIVPGGIPIAAAVVPVALVGYLVYNKWSKRMEESNTRIK